MCAIAALEHNIIATVDYPRIPNKWFSDRIYTINMVQDIWSTMYGDVIVCASQEKNLEQMVTWKDCGVACR